MFGRFLGRVFSSRNLQRRSRLSRSSSGLQLELLEGRTLMTATPVGTEIEIQDVRGVSNLISTLSPAVDLTSSGEAVVAFRGRTTGARSPGDDIEIFARRLASGGALTGDLIAINQITRGLQADPDIARAEDGTFIVVWHGRGAGDREGIFARRFNANGTAAGDQIRLNGTVGGTQQRPSIAMAPDGRAVVVWEGAGGSDGDGIFMRRLTRTGLLDGAETRVNTTTAGLQAYADVEMADDGTFVVTWSSRAADANDWDVLAQRFSANGTAQGSEITVNTTRTNSQYKSAVGIAEDGEFVVAWSSLNQDGDSWGVFSQRFTAAGTTQGTETRINQTTSGEQQDVSLGVSAAGEFIASWNQRQSNGNGWEIFTRAFSADSVADGDEVLVNTGRSGSDSGNQTSPAVAIGESGAALVVFDSLNTSGGSGVFAQQYTVTVAPIQNVAPVAQDIPNQTLRVGESLNLVVTATDANRRDDLTFRFETGQFPTGATITRIDNRSARVQWTPSAANRNQTVSFRILIDDNGTPLLGTAEQFTVNVVNAPPVVDVNGPATGTGGAANLPQGQTIVALTSASLTLTDADQTTVSSAAVAIKAVQDGASERILVDTTGTSITSAYNAGTGILSLSGSDTVANYQRVLRTLRYENTATTPNTVQRRIEITVNDGTATSAIAEVLLTIGNANRTPTLEAIQNVTVLAGSPLIIPLIGADADGDALTFSATSTNTALVTPSIPTGNRSARVTVSGLGNTPKEMVFELFEDLAPRATSRFVELANDNFFDNVIFHRVIDNFVIQAGSKTGDGAPNPTIPDFDDQFSLDLQHNRTGLLSMAKGGDDTNDTQFFVTEGGDVQKRNLDYNHTIFGILVEGESVREEISAVATDNGDKPLSPVTMTNVEIFTDRENGVLFLKAPHGQTGTSTVTVTASDGRGGQVQRTFNVTVEADTINSQPFLQDIPLLQMAANTPLNFQLQARDVEGDQIFFLDQAALTARGISVPATADPRITYSVNATSGQLTFNAPAGVTGDFRVTVAASSTLTPSNGSPLDFQVITIRVT
jgi:cyclophilin family peptidyl-prolyl cis-trans isomerase